MGTFIPNTKKEQQDMLHEIGCKDWDDLFKDIPPEARVKGGLNLPPGKSEAEVSRIMEKTADKNVVFHSIFRGAGAYNHYVPASVNAIAGKEEFLTAYTPYQAEISQGILQSIFEYQTMICELTGMDVSNASLYDGASAAAEACAMTRDRKRSVIYVSETVDPRILQVIRTYSFGREMEVKTVPASDGATDTAALKEMLDADPASACFLMQYPNYYGIIEDADAIAEIVHASKTQLIMSVNPIALGILKSYRGKGTFVINDDITYHQVSEFKQPENLLRFQQLSTLRYRLDMLQKMLDKTRNVYAVASTEARKEMVDDILTAEQEVLMLHQETHKLEKTIRNTENTFLTKSK